MSDLIFEDNEDNPEMVLNNPEAFVEELEASIEKISSQGDVRRRLEVLLQKKRLEEELDDEFSDDDY